MEQDSVKIAVRDSEGRYVVRIVYEDDHIMVVDKPAGLLTIPDHWNKEKACLQQALESYLRKKDKNAKLYVVHRLDKETSGVMLFAKQAEAHRTLSIDFENRRVFKSYLALVKGHPIPEEGIVDAPIGARMSRGGKKEIDFKHGRPSLTEYRVIRKFKNFSLVEASPKTGRMHQIRVHLSHLGYPLAVDRLYTDREITGIGIGDIKRGVRKKDDAKYIIKRLTLHASSVTFNHPVTGKEMSFTVIPPKDFASLIKQLEKWSISAV